MGVYQILSLIGIPTLVGIIITDLVSRLKASTKKARERKEQENKAIIRSVMKEEIDPLMQKTTKLEDGLDLMKKGTQASLRNNLYELYDVCSQKGYATYDERNNFENLYNNYHKLGSNGVMDDIHKKFLDLKIDNQK